MKKLLLVFITLFSLLISGCGSTAIEKQMKEFSSVTAPEYQITKITSRKHDRFNVEVSIPEKYNREQVENISKQVIAKVYKDSNGKVYGIYVQTRLPGAETFYMVYEYGPNSSASWNEKTPADQNPGLKLNLDLSRL